MSKDIVSRETIEYKKQWTQSVWETVQANGTQIQQKNIFRLMSIFMNVEDRD